MSEDAMEVDEQKPNVGSSATPGSDAAESAPTLASVFSQILSDINNLRDPKDPNHDCSDVFQTLPDRKLTHYYRIIKRPMSLFRIKTGVKRGEYEADPRLFFRDLAQIVWNAKTFNLPDSFIYTDAVIVDEYLRNKIKELNEHPPVSQLEGIEYQDLGPIPTAEEIEQMATLPEDDDAKRKRGRPRKVFVPEEEQAALIAAAQERQNPRPQLAAEVLPSRRNLRLRTSLMSSLHRDDDDDDDSDLDSDDDSDSDSDDDGGRRRSGRPRRAAVTAAQRKKQQEMSSNPHGSSAEDRRRRRGRPPTVDKPHEARIKAINRGVRRERDDEGRFRFLAFEKLPDPKTYPEYYEQISHPIALDVVRKKIKGREYLSLEAYLDDMKLLFNNARSFNEPSSEIYEDADALEQVMDQLADEERKKPDSVYQDPESNSRTSRLPLDSVEHRGETYRVGDWVHISNQNDPSKPTIGQIFTIWQAPDGQKWVNACWYYRAEQTVHEYHKLFYENEVVKSGQYRDHLVDEILEKCFVMFVTKYQRGRPTGIGTRSVYCVESRYNENEKTFNKIRTWKACLPNEVRSTDYPMDLFDRQQPLRRVVSPIKHLLPPDAKDDDPIPEPKMGVSNAPPIVGAVYKRPIDPNDPPEIPSADLPDPPTPQYSRPQSQPNQPSQPGYQTANSQFRVMTANPSSPMPMGGAGVVGVNGSGISSPYNSYHGPTSSFSSSPAGSANVPYSTYRNYTPAASVTSNNSAIGNMPSYTPAPPTTFTLPETVQALLEAKDWKTVQRANGSMAWFAMPPVYVGQRLRSSLKAIRSYNGVVFESDAESQDDDKELKPYSLGHSAAYLRYRINKTRKA